MAPVGPELAVGEADLSAVGGDELAPARPEAVSGITQTSR